MLFIPEDGVRRSYPCNQEKQAHTARETAINADDCANERTLGDNVLLPYLKRKQIIEDIIPLYDVKASVKTDKAPKRVYLAPEGRDIPFTYENGRVDYTVDKLDLCAMVVIDY